MEEKNLPADLQAANNMLTSDQRDALGEVGNICMGTCATTLSQLLGKRVVITTPKVSICRRNEFFDEYEKPIMAAEISYTQGIQGNNILLLKKEDALIISNLLMGNDISSTEEESTELFSSVISEVMNQMVGSSSTAMADILESPVNIAPPTITELKPDGGEPPIEQEEIIVKISFRMEIEDLIDSNIMQIMSLDFGKRLANSLMHVEEAEVEMPQRQNVAEQTMQQTAPKTPPPRPQPQTPPRPQQQTPPRPQPTTNYTEPHSNVIEGGTVDIKAAKYQSFDAVEPTTHTPPTDITSSGNMDLIVDVPLQVTVVLGKSKKSIKDILAMNIGSVIVLDRLAGERVDVLVNGKLFAHGEVVVIDDNYGVRITDIVSAMGDA